MGSPSTPSAPDPAKTYQSGINVLLKNLPAMLNAEQGYRSSIDPQRIAAQQAIQKQYGPTQYGEQLSALGQLDPTGTNLRSKLGTAITGALSRGAVDPRQAALYQNLSKYVTSGLQRGGLDPTQEAVYKQLGQSVQGNLARGSQQTPDQLQQDTQSVRAGQAARGNILGDAPATAEALYAGQRGQQLLAQRQGAAQGFASLQAPGTTAYQAGAQLYGMPSPTAGAFNQAGTFLSSPTPEQQLLAIQGVQPDRSNAYVNPNAGYLGQQFGLQNYQNLLAQQSASGGGSNPWASALTGAASGAIAGTQINPGYGTVIGAAAGGLYGGLGSAFG
jgi:hypothetical protein